MAEPSFPDWTAAAQLEAQLGSPRTATQPGSWARAVDADEREAYPQEFVERLHALRFHHLLIPQALGGGLTSLPASTLALRAVARRDLSCAIALGQTFLGSVPCWLGGTEAQQRHLAEQLLGGAQAAFALTEEAHGADVLASEVTASPEPGGYRLRGTKWLINNGTRGAFLSVLARSSARPGPRALSLFLVERARLADGSWNALAKQRTHGIRGADISGVTFDGARVDESARLGAEGHGVELTLATLQLTRIGCSAFSLGAADTALRVAVDFVKGRRLYGETVAALPHVRATLVDAFADALACECLALTALRLAHAAPEQLALASAVVKAEVPTRVERLIHALGGVVGARHYVRHGLADGVFQKLLRDAAVVPLFDGSTAVNLDSLSAQLPLLLRTRPAPLPAALATDALDWRASPPPLTWRPHPLVTTQDALLGALDDVTARAAQRSPALSERLTEIAASLRALADWLPGFLRAQGRAAARSAPLFAAARRYAAAWGQVAVASVWLQHQGAGGFLEEPAWALRAMDRLAERGDWRERPAAEDDALWRQLSALHDEERALSLVPLTLGR